MWYIRKVVPPYLDSSDSDEGSREGSRAGDLSSDIRGSGSAGVGMLYIRVI